MASFLNPLLRRALTQAAGSAAAAKLGERVAQQASELTGWGGPSDADRTRFLVWLRGDFRAREPQAFAGVWRQIQLREAWAESEGRFAERDLGDTLLALTAIWMELRSEAEGCVAWFRDLGGADDDDFGTLVEAVRPPAPELQQNVESVIQTAAERVRKFDPATPEGQRRVADGAKKVRRLGDQLFGKRNKRTRK